MTADAIIAANPDFGFEKAKVGPYDGLIGTEPGTAKRVAVLYCAGMHVTFDWPMRPETIDVAWQNLERAVSNGMEGHA